MSDESQDLKPTAGIYACQTPDREESSLEREKAEINNALLKGLVERNEQRKKHRGCLFGFGIAACAVFYFLFIVTVCYLYFCHLYALEPHHENSGHQRERRQKAAAAPIHGHCEYL